jgi:hypothetical protein
MGEIDSTQPFHVTDEDKRVLALTDDEYPLLSWEFCKEVIGISTLFPYIN